MKAMLHGLPEPFITISKHCKVGEVVTWVEDDSTTRKFKVHKCDSIGDNPETQLQNVYLREVGFSE